MGCRKIAICVSADAAYALTLKSYITSNNLPALGPEDSVDEAIMSCGTARCNTEGVFQMSQGVKQMRRIPAEDLEL